MNLGNVIHQQREQVHRVITAARDHSIAASMALTFHYAYPRNRSARPKESDVDVLLMTTAVIQSPLSMKINDCEQTGQRWIWLRPKSFALIFGLNIALETVFPSDQHPADLLWFFLYC